MEAAMRQGATLTTANGGGGFGGFWSGLGSGVATGISRLAADVLPNWAAKELKVQKTDQLAQPTMFWGAAPTRIDYPIQTAEAGAPVEGLWRKVLFDVGGVQVTTSTLVLMTGALIALLFVFKKLR